jgi:hypothetical protein
MYSHRETELNGSSEKIVLNQKVNIMKSSNFKKRVLPVLIGTVFSVSAFAAMPTLTDTNGDGVISADEITAIRDAQRATDMATFDTDGNGELSRTERRAMQDARYEAMLQANDADGDGELSREERSAAKDAHRAAIEAQLDVNQDGEVSDEERAGFDEVKGDKKGKKHGKGKKGKGKKHGKGKKGERHELNGDQNTEIEEENQEV